MVQAQTAANDREYETIFILRPDTANENMATINTRIRGVIPAQASPTPDLLNVVVSVDSLQDTLSGAFRYLPGPGLELARWETRASIPQAVGGPL